MPAALSKPAVDPQRDRLTISLPPRPVRSGMWVLPILFALPFFAFFGFVARGFVTSQPTSPPQTDWGGRIVGCGIGGIALLPLIAAAGVTFPFMRTLGVLPHANGLRPAGIGVFDVFHVLAVVVPLAIGLGAMLALRGRSVFETRPDGLCVTVQSPLRRSVRQWPAEQIDRLVVETQTIHRAKGGATMSRQLILLLKDGKRRRLASARGQRDFGWLCETLTAGLQQAGVPAAWPGVNPQPARRPPAPRAGGVAFAVFASIFFVAGWTLAILQDDRLQHAVPVQATVLSVKREPLRDRHGGAIIGSQWAGQYRYAVAGHSYDSSSIFATDMTGPVEDQMKQHFLSTLHEGQTVPAWYMPTNPTTVFVVRDRLFGPYLFIFFSMLFIAVGLSLALQPRAPKGAPADAPLPHDTWRRRIITLFWTVCGTAAVSHYLSVWPTTWHLDFIIIASIWCATTIGLLLWWRRGEQINAARPLYRSAPFGPK